MHTVTALSVLRAPARGVRALEAEAGEHERAIRAIVRAWRPDLLDLSGVGPTIAATALAAWSHPGRSRSDAAFAILAGAAPIPASSGKTVRYRLNRSGNQQLNRAMHNIALSRLRFDPDTRTFADTRRARARPTATSNAATSAIYPASSTDSPNQEPERLTNHSDT